MLWKNDMYCGLALLLAGGFIAWEASSFPALAGMPYGAGLFPTIAASGMALCGFLILLTSVLAKSGPGKKAERSATDRISMRAKFNFSSIVITVIIYALSIEYLGFHIISFLALLVLFGILQVNKLLSLLMAVMVTMLVHFIFYSILHVPLPWGLLEPIAW